MRGEVRAQPVDVFREIVGDVIHIKHRRHPADFHFRELLLATRTPRQHAARARLAKTPERAPADLVVGLQIAVEKLVDTAAVRGAADDVIVDRQNIQQVHDAENDLRRAQDIAAGIEDHIGLAALGRRRDALQSVRGDLHAGQQPHRLRHRAETLRGIGRPCRQWLLGFDVLQPRHRHPLPHVDVLGAGRRAVTTAVAGFDPGPCDIVPLFPLGQSHQCRYRAGRIILR
jgi:hypothetical protein